MKRVGLVLGALLAFVLLSGHEFWLAPGRYVLALGETVPVGMYVGENFQGERRWLKPARTLRLEHVWYNAKGEAQRLDLVPTNAPDSLWPIAQFQSSQPGTHVLVYEGRPSFIRLEAAKFNAYLAEDGLTGALAQRKAAGLDTASARELYSRHCKTLLRVGGPSASRTYVERPEGLELEIVPEADPYLRPDSTQHGFRVLFRRKPLAGVKVVAWSRNLDELDQEDLTKLEAVTSRNGWVRFDLNAKGHWLVSAVHMVPHTNPSEAEWRSYWASLTFAR